MQNSIQDTAILQNGVPMPWLGLGVFGAEAGREVKKAVRCALDYGYRSIDTAFIYHNESGVGEAVAESGIKREEIFITTKVWNASQGYESTRKAFAESLRKLACDYVDLYLIHWPVQGKFVDTWRALEDLYGEKKVRAIGVSNFLIHHLEELLPACRTTPMVNQVEFHPYLAQPELRAFCRQQEIQFEAWSPLMRGKIVSIPAISQLARQHDRTPAQIVLRWNLQHGVVTIPKSVRRERIMENSRIFDFQLSPEDMAQIDALDQNQRIGPDPDNFNF